ncbi:hypothetical protein EW145_g4982 [Phellinidium pouzarii]|uniref:Uncharacterized protein n=1 Tax=Phellinidium pouzarii TaxID=167371 RepID=A0A4S4L6G5_9AGAM|nr:hypothetical protein EW145_g4982 [Phellinidium pouzarii]
MLRFPRRYPLALLIFLIPLSITFYAYYGHISAWASNRIVPMTPDIFGHSPAIAVDDDASNSEILLVSAFFPLSKSKHSMRQYSDWLSRFLQPIATDIYFYTTPELEETIRKIRGSLPITVDTRFASVFDVPPLLGREGDYEKMHGQDREKDHHSPELYAIWAAKPFMLAEALRMVPEDKYRYAFWSDAGSFRKTHTYSLWPDMKRVEEIWEEGRELSGTKKEDLIFFPMQRAPDVSMVLWNENLGPIDNDFSEGSFFGGQPKTVAWWEKYYYAYHDDYIARHVFVGKDQSLINSLFLLHPERVVTVWHGDPVAPAALFRPETYSSDDSELILGDCGNPWYYYHYFLASEKERKAMSRVWDSTWNLEIWRTEWWTRKRETCRVTRTLAMETLLKRTFGEAWTPPQATVPL